MTVSISWSFGPWHRDRGCKDRRQHGDPTELAFEVAFDGGRRIRRLVLHHRSGAGVRGSVRLQRDGVVGGREDGLGQRFKLFRDGMIVRLRERLQHFAQRKSVNHDRGRGGQPIDWKKLQLFLSDRIDGAVERSSGIRFVEDNRSREHLRVDDDRRNPRAIGEILVRWIHHDRKIRSGCLTNRILGVGVIAALKIAQGVDAERGFAFLDAGFFELDAADGQERGDAHQADGDDEDGDQDFEQADAVEWAVGGGQWADGRRQKHPHLGPLPEREGEKIGGRTKPWRKRRWRLAVRLTAH